MSPSFAEHPQMTVTEFEQIARTAPETVTLEFIQGKLEVKPVPDGDHDEITMWVLRQCMQQRPELALYPERGLAVERTARGAPVPTARWRRSGRSPERASGPTRRAY